MDKTAQKETEKDFVLNEKKWMKTALYTMIICGILFPISYIFLALWWGIITLFIQWLSLLLVFTTAGMIIGRVISKRILKETKATIKGNVIIVGISFGLAVIYALITFLTRVFIFSPELDMIVGESVAFYIRFPTVSLMTSLCTVIIYTIIEEFSS